jgi:hypothetical protein
MRDFLIAAIARKILGRGETMGKRIAVDVGSHGTKRKASQKLAFPIAIVKTFPAQPFSSCPFDGAVNGLLAQWM